jgi:16S rRNA processing protein RimM
MTDASRVVLGRVSGVYGVRGWLKVHSYTEPRVNVVGYRQWWLCAPDGTARRYEVTDGREQGRTVVAHLAGVDDRDSALALMDRTIEVERGQLPATAPGEYYWADLENLRVLTRDGVELGRVDYMLATPAHDVMVIRGERERLVPFVQGKYVHRVDLDAGVIEVDWDPDYL